MRALPSAVRAALHVLEDRLPTDLPVEVERAPLGWWGDCNLIGGEYRIRIFDRIPPRRVLDRLWMDTLAHEWAHARAWRARSKQEHPDAWGIEFARAYRLLIDGVR